MPFAIHEGRTCGWHVCQALSSSATAAAGATRWRPVMFVASRDAALAWVRSHRPEDQASVTIQHADGATRVVPLAR